ncbi:dipeptidyl-peptidase 3 family protein [Mangrovibacterium marinum]|nr:Zn-dependent hydrolase [Mangrovibacterium marinum]
MKKIDFVVLGLAVLLTGACRPSAPKETHQEMTIEQKAASYAPFKLTTDTSVLSESEQKMLPLLFQAAQIMDNLFWKEAYGDQKELLARSTSDAMTRVLEINYGPWERLNGNQAFMDSVGPKPPGAQFYPADMTKAEFEAWDEPAKTNPYTLIVRDSLGQLQAVPYHIAFQAEVAQAAELIRQAAGFADDPGLRKYLELRAQALLTDDYYASDMAWMDMKNNVIDFVVGPIENYEDQLYGYKAAHEAYLLVKDKAWSARLDKFADLLPELQRALPCDAPYKSEMPGSDSDLNAYDVIYYAGDCNAGSKTIAINLPNDERVRAEKGSRKLQLKNAMQAKFDCILLPIAKLMMAEDQRKYVKFDAFFENTMFHEVAHGLGMGNTIDGTKTVRQALRDTYTTIEEGKADILGLWAVCKLNEMGELGDKDLMDNFVTFMAGIFRSVRFGAASAHGKANMIRFYYFQNQGAFERDALTGTYRVDFEKMKQAMMKLADQLLTMQGNGDYEQAASLIEQMGTVRDELQNDLDRINDAGIPIDIFFQQGPEFLAEN